MKKDEFLKNYGTIELSFSEYYKFYFTYEGYSKSWGQKILIICGGDSGEVYRFNATRVMTVNDILDQIDIDSIELWLDNKQINLIDD